MRHIFGCAFGLLLATSVGGTWSGTALQAERASARITARAVVPTAPGEIGIDPWFQDLGDPNEIAAVVGPQDSAFLTLQQDGNYGYIATADTELAVTTTDGGTSTIKIAAVTATAAADGFEVGDVAVVLPEAMAASLRDSVFAAVQECGGQPVRVRRNTPGLLPRQTASDLTGGSACLLRAAGRAAGNDGVWAGVENSFFETFDIQTVGGWEALAKAAAQVAWNKAVKNKVAIFTAAASWAAAAYLKHGYDLEKARQEAQFHKLRIPKEGFGQPAKGPEQPPETETCPNPNLDENSPECRDLDCVGENNKCTIGPNKDCPCANVAYALGQW
jgi:hypothetical protein